jgi:uncharacterized protein involved in exopolysaccharide biosynthesis
MAHRGVSPRYVLAALFKDKWRLLWTFLLVMAASVLFAYLVTPKFVAEAKLYVKFGREYTYRAQAGDTELVAESFDRGQVIKSEIEILRAQDLADQVIAKVGLGRLYPELLRPPSGVGVTLGRLLREGLERIGLGPAASDTPPLPPTDQARAVFMQNLDAHGGSDSNVITVGFAHPGPRMAAEALDALIDAYMSKRRPLFAELRAPTLEPELASAKARLRMAEDELAEFQAATGIVSYDAQRQILLDQQGGCRAICRPLKTTLPRPSNVRSGWPRLWPPHRPRSCSTPTSSAIPHSRRRVPPSMRNPGSSPRRWADCRRAPRRCRLSGNA